MSTVSEQEPETREPGAVEPEEQLELDLGELPGGVAGAVEAVLMVVDQPLTEDELA